MTYRHELIDTNGERRAIRRDENGRCRESDDLGESVSGVAVKRAKSQMNSDHATSRCGHPSASSSSKRAFSDS